MSWRSTKSGLIGALLLVPMLFAGSVEAQDAKPFSNEQLDQLTAQVALYPDSLLAQLLMATTYPEDFAAAAAWSKAHPDAKGDDAVKMVENEPWDPSVASLVAFPEVLITLNQSPEWVRNIGDAFLAQPDDVMNSVQRLRQKAQAAGNLKSNEQVNVSMQAPEPAPPPATQTVVVQQSAPPPQVIVIEPAQPSVVCGCRSTRPSCTGRGRGWLTRLSSIRRRPASGGRDRLPRASPGVWHRGDQRVVGRRPLGRAGPQQRQHQRQPLQQHQRQPPDRQQQQERELESQSGPARQRAVPRRRLNAPGFGEPIPVRQPRAVPRP